MKNLGAALLVLLFCGTSVVVWGQAKGYREQYEGYLWKNGQLLHVRDGKPVVLKEPVKLKNGAVLYPAGYAVSVQGKQHKLREGESLDSNGNVLYPEYRKDGIISFLSHEPTNYKKKRLIPVPEPPAHIKIKKSKD